MDTEQALIRDFLAAHHPFDQLPDPVLDALPAQMETCRLKPGELLLRHDTRNGYLHVLRSGNLEIQDPEGGLLARLEEGHLVGQRSLLGNGITANDVRAVTEVTLYRLPAATFHQICKDHPSFLYFFGPGGRLRGALRGRQEEEPSGIDLMSTQMADLVGRSPITLPPSATIRQAAELMTRENVSSLLVVDDDRLRGIVTDRDLRRRVIAAGLSYEQSLADIMTDTPATIDAADYAYDALMLMAQKGIHHLPVLGDRGRPLGMITSTDLVQRRTNSPLYLIGDIYKQTDPQGLAQSSHRLQQLLLAMVGANASAHSIGHVISSIGEAISCRLLALAEEKLGPPPVPYAWLTGGSMGRREQTAHSDQDNGLLLDDSYDEQRHGEYFREMARFVCDGLAACGYIYCPGDIMATTDKWRQPLRVWQKQFDAWIDTPDPKALLNATIFFDIRCLYGEAELFRQLQTRYLEKAKANRIFQVYLAGNAMGHQPPLGFFRSFVLVKDGKHDNTLDLKLSGVVPIIDLARVYALSGGIPEVNTRDRLEAAAGQGSLSRDGAADLIDALEFISMIRLRHQARRIQEGKAPDNFMPPSNLSHFERNHLKDAFSVVSTLQNTLSNRFQLGRF